MFQLLSKEGIKESPVETLEPPGTWTAFSIAIFHQKVNFISEISNDSDELLDRHQSVGVKSREMELDLMVTSKTQLVAQGKKHGNFWCNGCFHVSHIEASMVQRICELTLGKKTYGQRYHCADCFDFDYCFMCKLTADKTHWHHSWETIEEGEVCDHAQVRPSATG
jgi:hypothetical protein